MLVGLVDQLDPDGQIRFEHVGSLKLEMSVDEPHPSKHVHLFVDDENVPCKLQLLSQSVFCATTLREMEVKKNNRCMIVIEKQRYSL